MAGFGMKMAIRIAERAGYRCEMCNKDLSKVLSGQVRANFELHSVTGFHLDRVSRDYCKATNPPPKYARMRGRLLPTKAFKVFTLLDRADDGFCLCSYPLGCHDELHNIAREETKLFFPECEEGIYSPAMLEDISLHFILDRKRF